MAETTQEVQEAPELAALGSPDVASGDLPIGLRALIDAYNAGSHNVDEFFKQLEDFVKPHTLEERIYRLRCVEAWSMVIPWTPSA